MAKSRRRFTKEFKAEVVNLIMKEGRAVSAVCRELDLHESPVRRWVQQAEIDVGRGAAGALTTEERQELSALRREVRQLRMDREILKKTAVFFAKENG